MKSQNYFFPVMVIATIVGTLMLLWLISMTAVALHYYGNNAFIQYNILAFLWAWSHPFISIAILLSVWVVAAVMIWLLNRINYLFNRKTA